MVNIKYDRENLILKAKGHANSTSKDKDIICACVSMLMYTLAQNIKFLQDAKVAKNVHCIIEDGNCLVSCEAVEEKETLLCTYDTITTGFVLLQANYPDNVKFIEK